MSTSRRSFAFLLVALAVIAGCASEKGAWKDAQAEDSVASYEAFLAEYPDGELAGDARGRIQALDFAAAQGADSISAFEGFLEHHSAGEFVGEAERLLEGLFFRDAETADSITGYQDFLARYSSGELVDRAADRLEALRLLARAGQWDYETSFGSLMFVVAPSGEELSDLHLTWDLGGISGTFEFNEDFSLPIDDDGRFKLEFPDTLILRGEFSGDRPMATGYWEMHVPVRKEPLKGDWEVVREAAEPAV